MFCRATKFKNIESYEIRISSENSYQFYLLQLLGSLHELVPLIKKPINRFRFGNSKGFGPVRLCINIETVVDIHCFHIGDSPVLPRPTAWRQSGIERWQEEEEEGCYSDLNIASIEKYDK